MRKKEVTVEGGGEESLRILRLHIRYYAERLNKDSESVFFGKAEPYLSECVDGKPFQLMRTGYYKKSSENRLTLSEIVSLKDNFNK